MGEYKLPNFNCSKTPCPVCNTDEVSLDINCKRCNGDGFLFTIENRSVTKEEYREYYNSRVNVEDDQYGMEEEGEKNK